jgi:hypothetical protein
METLAPRAASRATDGTNMLTRIARRAVPAAPRPPRPVGQPVALVRTRDRGHAAHLWSDHDHHGSANPIRVHHH